MAGVLIQACSTLGGQSVSHLDKGAGHSGFHVQRLPAQLMPPSLPLCLLPLLASRQETSTAAVAKLLLLGLPCYSDGYSLTAVAKLLL